MSCTISYGVDSSFDLELSSERAVTSCRPPLMGSLLDPAAAVAAALDDPLDFPPLARAMAPGDRIVLALDGNLPQLGELTSATADYLLAAGAQPEELTLLRTKADAEADLEEFRELLPPGWRDSLKIEVHDPAAKSQLSLLGQSQDGRPIYMNRTLLDADLVVPLGCLQPTGALGYHGRHGSLFPTFADEKTVQRFRKPRTPEGHRQVEESQRREIDEIGWLLGVQFTLQVVPGPGDSVLAVLAGETNKVFEEGQRRCDEVWRYQAPARASLVLAAVSGRPGLQSWENVARALANAGRVVVDEGAIALCTALEAPPGPAVAGLSRTDDWQAALRRIRRDCPPDALSAAELIDVADRARIYLLSRLDESLVEDLGLAPISGVADLIRLAGRHSSCLVLADAQRLSVSVADE